MMKNKSVPTAILRDYYVIDSILLNQHAKKYFKEDSDFNDYVSIKASLLSTLFEFYQHIGYKPVEDMNFKDTKALCESAVQYAKKSKHLSSTMLQKPVFQNEMKKFIKESAETNSVKDIREFSKKVIAERFNRMCLDNVLIGIPVLESKHPEKANDFRGKILEEAYMMMRNSLIRHAKTAEVLKRESSKAFV